MKETTNKRPRDNNGNNQESDGNGHTNADHNKTTTNDSNARKNVMNLSVVERTANATTTTIITDVIRTDRESKKRRICKGTTKSYARSVKEYFKQIRIRKSMGRDRNISCNETGEGLKYLPRPEWCSTVVSLMLSELMDATKFHYDDCFGGLMGMNGMCCNNYDALIRVCTFDYKQKSPVFLSGFHITENPEKLDFVQTQLKWNAIYFDIDEYMWRTKRIETANTSDCTVMNDTSSDHHSMRCASEMSSVNVENHHQDQLYRHTKMTYEELIHPTPPRHHHRQTFGKDEDTILHLAIRANATILALDIIRIEYNTVRDLASRYHELRNTIFTSLLSIGNEKGVTPLILAAQKGNLVVVQELLRSSGGVLLSKGSAAILQAAHFGHDHVIEYILEYYHVHNEAQLKSAYSWSWPESLVDLIDQPSRPNKTTSLMRAAQEGHLSTVNLLLQHGASVHRRNNASMAPLMFAAQRGHALICRQLIKHGADVDARNNQSLTALLLACKRGHVAVVKELVTAFCNIDIPDDRDRTALQMVQRRIQRHHQHALNGAAAAVLLPPPRAQNRRSSRQSRITHRHTRRYNRVHDNENGDDNNIDNDADVNSNQISIHTDRKLLQLLNIHTQVELKQFSVRVARNYEIIRMHTLIHQNRVDITVKPKEPTYDVPSAVEWLTKLTNDDSDGTSVPSIEHSQRQRRKRQNLPSSISSLLDDHSKQVLIRTMLLPAPIVQMIALFLPLPRLWKQRMFLLGSPFYVHRNPNIAIIYALDVLDEILEDVGLLLAFDAAKIPAPTPHRSWCDWKRDEKCRTSDDANISLNNLVAIRQSRSITESLPPSSQDETRPTICEMRRLAGYLPLISKYQSSTAITTILSGEPHNMPRYFVRQLLRFADMASICRCCCIKPLLHPVATVPPPPPNHTNPLPTPNTTGTTIKAKECVHFQPNMASEIQSLVEIISQWYSGNIRYQIP